MKLVEILAEEMEEWPVGVTNLTQSNVDREIYNALDGKKESSVDSLNPRFDTSKSHSEGAYPIVTRAQWQAERDRQKGVEWKRHRGGKCPVEARQQVEVRFRDGEIQQSYASDFFGWEHGVLDDKFAEVMSYRLISQPQAEEVEARKLTQDLNMQTPQGEFVRGPISLGDEVIYPAEAKWDRVEGPLLWRDTVNELDAYIEEYTRERDALIERLASEGFALIPAVVNAGANTNSGIPIDEWQIGDIIRVVSTSDDSCAPLGVFTITDIDWEEPKYELDNEYYPNHDQMKFIRRP